MRRKSRHPSIETPSHGGLASRWLRVQSPSWRAPNFRRILDCLGRRANGQPGQNKAARKSSAARCQVKLISFLLPPHPADVIFQASEAKPEMNWVWPTTVIFRVRWLSLRRWENCGSHAAPCPPHGDSHVDLESPSRWSLIDGRSSAERAAEWRVRAKPGARWTSRHVEVWRGPTEEVSEMAARERRALYINQLLLWRRHCTSFFFLVPFSLSSR